MKERSDKSALGEIMTGLLTACTIGVVLILVFAAVALFAEISDSLTRAIGIGIKITAPAVGIISALKGSRHILIKGIVIALLFTVVVYIANSILNSSFSLSIYDAIACGIAVLTAVLSSVIAASAGK